MQRKIITAAVAAALAVGPTFLVPTDEPFQNPPAGTVGHREYSWNSYVEIVGVRENQLNPYYMAKCGVDSPGQTCTISRTETLTRTISAEFGASDDTLAGSIGVSTSQAVAIQVGCQSPKMNTGEEYIAFPTERYFYYRVVKDQGAFVTDLGEYIPSDDITVSPVAVAAVYDEGFRCRVQPQPS